LPSNHGLFELFEKRLNSSFSFLNFKKLRFLPPKKKQQNRTLSFAPVAVLAP